jgi:hypothetical protein
MVLRLTDLTPETHSAAQHWVFAGVPMEVAQIIASRFSISVERQGSMLYNLDSALNKSRVFFVIRGKVSRTAMGNKSESYNKH